MTMDKKTQMMVGKNVRRVVKINSQLNVLSSILETTEMSIADLREELDRLLTELGEVFHTDEDKTLSYVLGIADMVGITPDMSE